MKIDLKTQKERALTWVPLRFFPGREEAARKFAYKLVFEPFKTTTVDCPRVSE
jgi:hypothetical protein